MPNQDLEQIKKDRDALSKENKTLKTKLKNRQRILRLQLAGAKLMGGFGALLTIGPRLYSAIHRWIVVHQENPNRLAPEETAAVIAALIRRFTAIGLIGLIIAGVPVALLFQQNRILNKQNAMFDQQNKLFDVQTEFVRQQTDLLAKQTEFIDRQNYLVEASRRSALLFELTSILDMIDAEMDAAGTESSAVFTRMANQEAGVEPAESLEERPRLRDEESQKLYRLSSRLTGRIVALSRSFRPYRYLDDSGQLIERPLSPERAQLFISLIESQVDMEDMNHSRVVFDFADLASVGVQDLDLTHTQLKRANLQDASFSNCRLHYARFIDCDLKKAGFSSCEMWYGDFTNCDLREAKFSWNTSDGWSFNDCDLRFAILKDSLSQDSSNGWSFRNCDLSYADLRGLNVRNTDWKSIKSIKGANIADIDDPQGQFTQWAMSEGAVQITDQKQWMTTRKDALEKMQE